MASQTIFDSPSEMFFYLGIACVCMLLFMPAGSKVGGLLLDWFGRKRWAIVLPTAGLLMFMVGFGLIWLNRMISADLGLFSLIGFCLVIFSAGYLLIVGSQTY